MNDHPYPIVEVSTEEPTEEPTEDKVITVDYARRVRLVGLQDDVQSLQSVVEEAADALDENSNPDGAMRSLHEALNIASGIIDDIEEKTYTLSDLMQEERRANLGDAELESAYNPNSMTYEVVTASTAEELAELVTQRTAENWNISGSMAVSDGTFHQPMIKYPEPDMSMMDGFPHF